MFIKRTTKPSHGKSYLNHLLVESISTPQGPRHRTVCSLGSLQPAPRSQWLALARKMETALAGQTSLLPDARVDAVMERVQAAGRRSPAPSQAMALEEVPAVLAIDTDQVEVEEPRTAGPIHVGHQMWKRLGLEAVLAQAGLGEGARLLTEVMTLNRWVSPCSEHAMPDWVRRTAMADILGRDFSRLQDETLYRNLDRLHPQRVVIERELAARERSLFNLEESIYLYDLTSTYFEGLCLANPKAKRGYSRDKRADCKQVGVGLVLDGDGFPKAHEVFAGNRHDKTTLEEMLGALEQRVGRRVGATVVVDRGMAYAENLKQIRACGYHYLVASRQEERGEHLEEFESEEGWQEMVRVPSPSNPAQKKVPVFVKRCVSGDEVHILCRSEGRQEKDRAIREKQEKRMLEDLSKLERRIRKGRLRAEDKVHQAIGRLQERYPRVARYYQLLYGPEQRRFGWQENLEKKIKAEQLDGGYVLKTDRQDLSEEEIWRTCILLTRVESAFRALKSPLLERPIFHHLERRVETHIFLCLLAYHLLVRVEKMFLDQGVHASWASLREQLSTHQVVTVVLKAIDGGALRIRKGTTPEPIHKEIYETLRIPATVMKPTMTWSPP